MKMYNNFVIEAIAIAAQASVGADMFSNDMKQRARDKWEKSKQLPRKQKKAMRKDALMDLTFAHWSDEFSTNLFKF